MPIVDIQDYPDDLRDAILEGESDPFDTGGLGLTWRAKERRLLLTDERGRPRAQAAYLLADVAVDGCHVPVAGLSAVLVAKSARGQGLARQVLLAAHDRMRATGRPFGLLFCNPDRTGLYQRLGWAVLRDAVVVDQPRGPIVMPQKAMWLALDAQPWPEGPVRLLGLPF